MPRVQLKTKETAVNTLFWLLAIQDDQLLLHSACLEMLMQSATKQMADDTDVHFHMFSAPVKMMFSTFLPERSLYHGSEL